MPTNSAIGNQPKWLLVQHSRQLLNMTYNSAIDYI